MIVYRELTSLETDLGIRATTLYGLSNSISRHYRRIELRKRDGGVRQLLVPDEALKYVQRKILEVLLRPMPVSPYARAYIDCGGTFKNAAGHVEQAKLLKLDIRHFFDSIRYSTVKERVFPSAIYSEPNRILLSMLCYHDQVLPQGAPTSPTISNIILREFDELIGQWCQERGITYTRYCDDMTFSGEFDERTVIALVDTELKKEGFLLNRKKTRVIDRHHSQQVTGIVVNKKPNIPKAYRRRLRQELYYCKQYGVKSHLERIGSDETEDKYLQRLLGKVNYVLSIRAEDTELLAYRQWLKKELISLRL